MNISRRRTIIENPKTYSWKRRFGAILRYSARRIAFSHPWISGLIERPAMSAEEAQRDWDFKLSQTHFRSYLGRTIAVDSSNAMTAMMIKYHAVSNPTVLDVGCGGGTLSFFLPPFSQYLGIDASQYAIECGRKDLADRRSIRLEAIDMRRFKTDEVWEVIVLNEVLYYLETNVAARQIERYKSFLAPDGIICIAMKDDPKSSAILRLLGRHLKWIDGMIWQRKPLQADYSIRIDRECPGFLLGVFRPS